MATSMITNTFKQRNLWGGIIPMQLFGLYAIYMIVTGSAPAWWWMTTIAGFALFVMTGITVGYHRLACHQAFTTLPWIKTLILFLGCLAGQESPIFWATVHRGYHHKHADTDNDPHSPTHGFWHGYILWMFKLENNLSARYTIDLVKDPICMFIHKHYHKILIGTHVVVAMINFDFWLYFMLLPAFLGLHSYALNTSASHIKSLGYRCYTTKDNSVNSAWLWPFMFGEAWHNNHHGQPQNPNCGHRHWWEIDPAYWIIKMIRTNHC
jgi:stearoyl-CoA desaturase (delta-9 desaturase)